MGDVGVTQRFRQCIVYIRTFCLPPCVTHLRTRPYADQAFCRGLIAQISSGCRIEGRMATIVGVPYGFGVYNCSPVVVVDVELPDATKDERGERLEFVFFENLPELLASLRKVEVPTSTGVRVCGRSLLPRVVELTAVLLGLFDSLDQPNAERTTHR